MTLSINKVNNLQTYNINKNTKRTNNNKALKTASAIGSTVGIATAMCAITKKSPLHLVNTIKKPEKMIQGLKKFELSGQDVIEIATSSIMGGFVAGSCVDPSNTKAKAKEGIMQLIGNYIIPSLFVTGGIKCNSILNNKFSKFPKTGIAKFTFGLLSLVAGVFAGNTVSKKVNEKVFKEDSYRPLKGSDWGMQLDNVCLVTSVSNAGTSIAKNASKVIPLAHFVPGYLTGIKE